VRAHPGPRVWAAWPLRGNQEAPSQAGGHARCSAREAAFVRASWVGPPNRASPMRAFVIALGRLRAVRERVGPRGQIGPSHCLWARRSGSAFTLTCNVDPPVWSASPGTTLGRICGVRTQTRAASGARGTTPPNEFAADPQGACLSARPEKRSRTHARAKPLFGGGRPTHSRTAPHVPRTIAGPRMGEALFLAGPPGVRTAHNVSRRNPGLRGRSPVWRPDP
jgi:hypothetical protein